MATHWHYMNGEPGCYPDSSDVYTRKKGAIELAEQLFGDTLCSPCFKDMSSALRTRGATAVIFYFNTDCERESVSGGQCSSGAGYVEIRREAGGLLNPDGELICRC